MPETQAPPQLAQRVRRLEWVVALAAGALLVLTGLFSLSGLLDAEGGAHESARTFRPLVADFVGSVDYRPVNATEWRPLRWSDAFSQGDQLRTGPDSTCDVLLTWNTGFRVAPGTELTWRRLQVVGGRADVELFLPKGQVLASLEDLAEGSRFVVETPHSRTRVKGTVLGVTAADDDSRTTVLEGVVEVIDRSDPTRRVEVVAGHGTTVDGDGPRRLELLSAEERARLLAENIEVRERVDRISPPREVDVVKGRVEISAEEVPGLEESSEVAEVQPDDEAPTEGVVRTDAQEVRSLLRAGLQLLARGHVEQALSYCTPTYKAYINGHFAQRAGAPRVYSRESGPTLAIQTRDVIRRRAQLEFALSQLDVLVDGDVAYGQASVVVTAQPVGAQSIATRRYACTARCLKQPDGRWLVDLTTANEGAR